MYDGDDSTVAAVSTLGFSDIDKSINSAKSAKAVKIQNEEEIDSDQDNDGWGTCLI